MIPPGSEPARPPLVVIVAAAANGVIGADNRLPWRLPADMRRFRSLTTGHAVIMGRRTWESLSGPLPDRQNIVVSRDPSYRATGAEVVASFDAALAAVRRPPPAFCIGGGELYRVALEQATAVYLTSIARAYPGDTLFPSLDPAGWIETAREDHAADGTEEPGYSFVTFERRRD